MTWIGSGPHIAILAGAFLAELLIFAHQLVTNHRRVSHRKLRAPGVRKGPATGSNAPRNAPVAGSHTPTLQAYAGAWTGGAAVRTSSETPPPAPGLPGSLPPGAGPNSGSPTVDLASTGTSRAVVDGGRPEEAQTVTSDSRQLSRPGGLGLKQPVTVPPPDVAVAGSQLPAMAQIDWGTAGAFDPETGAPAHVPMSQTIETAA